MKRFVAVVVFVSLLGAFAASPVSAHEYDRNDSDYWLRYVAYLVHPIGVALERTVTRPVHALAMTPGFNYWMGHEIETRTRRVETLVAVVPVEEPPPIIEDDNIVVDTTSKGLEFTLLGGVFFKPGSDELSDEGKASLDKLAEILKSEYGDQEIRFEGYTDNQPIKISPWKSNWELGSARSLGILHYLVDEHGLSPEKLSATTFGEHRPDESNETSEGRTTNRKAVIVVEPKE